MDYLELIARATSHIPDKGQVMAVYTHIQEVILKYEAAPSLPIGATAMSSCITTAPPLTMGSGRSVARYGFEY